jgi:LysR family hydrogen peroxide-inducible transcriptional activator
MQLRNIEYVLSIAETKSFSKSAKSLHISQPALSQAIQKLEEELGAHLFLRRSNETLLTRAGELFVEDARKILMLSEQIKKKMEDIHNVRQGHIVLGISQYNGQLYFSNILLEFKKEYPNIGLEIVEDFSSALEQKLLTGKLDCAIFTAPTISDELSFEHLFFEEILLALPRNHPIAEKFPAKPGRFGSVKLSWFKEEDFVLMKKGHRFRRITEDFCREAGFEPHVVFESRSSNTIQSFITGGVGNGFITTTQQRNTPLKWRSAYFHLEDVAARREHVIAYHKDSYLSSAAKAFISLAKKVCAVQFYYFDDMTT